MKVRSIIFIVFVLISLFVQAQSIPQIDKKIEPKATIPGSKVYVKVPISGIDYGTYFNAEDMVRIDEGSFWRYGPSRFTFFHVAVRAYFISKKEVTFDQYDAFCQSTRRTKPSDNGWGRGNRPVINVSYNDALAFCEWLKGKTGLNIRLPTEAEWEYAAAYAGSRGFDLYTSYQAHAFAQLPLPKTYPAWFGSGGDIHYHGWYANNSGGFSHPVGEKAPNWMGLYDMTGNVNEWCSDWYSDEDYFLRGNNNGYYIPTGNVIYNPTGPASGSKKAIRGGAYNSTDFSSVVGYRNSRTPTNKYNDVGFRIVYTAPY